MKRLAVAAFSLGCSSVSATVAQVDASAGDRGVGSPPAQITLPADSITVVRGESASFVAQIVFAEGAQPAVVDLPDGVSATETIVQNEKSTITIAASLDAPMASVPINVMIGTVVAKMQLDVASTEGSLDPAIGASGVVSIGGPVAGTAAAPDGSIFAVASASGANAFRVARLTADGALDAGFGSAGFVDIAIDGASSVTIRSLTVAPDGRAIIAFSAPPEEGVYFIDSAGDVTRVDVPNPSHVAPFQSGFLVSGSAGGVGFIDATNQVTLVASKPAHALGAILPWTDGSVFVGGRTVSGTITKLAPQSYAIDASFGSGGELLLSAPEVDVLVPDFANVGVVVAEGSGVLHIDTSGNLLTDLQTPSHPWAVTTALVPMSASQTFLAVGTTPLSGGDVIVLARLDSHGNLDMSFGLFGTASFVRAHDSLGDPNVPLPGGAFSNGHLWVAADDGVRAYRASP